MQLLQSAFFLLLAALAAIGGSFIVVNYVRAYRKGRFTDQGELNEIIEVERELMENPRFRDAELETGRRFPQAIKNLYARKELIHQKDFYFLDPIESEAAWSIKSFLPVSVMTIRERWPHLGNACFFAWTTEYAYYVPFESDPMSPTPVFVLNCLTGESMNVSESLNDFLNWPRIPAATYHKPHA
jgi:hypothetical protein